MRQVGNLIRRWNIKKRNKLFLQWSAAERFDPSTSNHFPNGILALHAPAHGNLQIGCRISEVDLA